MLLYVLASNDMALIARYLLTWVPTIIIAIALHEAGHAFSALYLGDRTAQLSGRCTLNPVAHFDPIGFLMVLFGPIGWGKPVPVNPLALRHPDRDMMLTAIAGPAVNVLLALLCAIGVAGLRAAFPEAFSYTFGGVPVPDSKYSTSVWLAFTFFQAGIALNLSLAFFNLVPLFPLDGEKVLAWFLPRSWKYWLESIRPQAPMILMMLIAAGWIFHLPVLWWAVVALGSPVSWLLTGKSLGFNLDLFFTVLSAT